MFSDIDIDIEEYKEVEGLGTEVRVKMAESMRFELTLGINLNSLSKRAP